MKNIRIIYLIGVFLYGCLTSSGQSGGSRPLPSFVKKPGGGYSFLVNGKPYLVLGAQLCATGKNVEAAGEVARNTDAVRRHIHLRMRHFVIPGGKDDGIPEVLRFVSSSFHQF